MELVSGKISTTTGRHVEEGRYNPHICGEYKMALCAAGAHPRGGGGCRAAAPLKLPKNEILKTQIL
jgi:hypothetical protein